MEIEQCGGGIKKRSLRQSYQISNQIVTMVNSSSPTRRVLNHPVTMHDWTVEGAVEG